MSPQRSMALVSLRDPETLADSIADAAGGRARGLALLKRCVAYLERTEAAVPTHEQLELGGDQ